jgi:dTDP-4-amino-4,6-dideoxygalactose transaminase
VLDGEGNSHYCLSVVLDGDLAGARDDVVARLGAEGVGTSLYYPKPVPRMQYYRAKYGDREGLYPNAAAISDRSIALPVGPHLEPDDVERIATSVVAALEDAA